MLRQFTVAAVQFSPELKEKANNINKLYQMAMDAAEKGAKLIVLPEMATTGYCFLDRHEIQGYVEQVPGRTTDIFGEIAREYGCYLVVGIAEVDPVTNNYYNTAVLIGPCGLVGKYRKTHLYVSDTVWAKEGDLGYPVFDTEIGKIGCLICMDYYYFEPARMLALQGTEILCNLSNWNEEKCPAPSWYTRAWENVVYVVSTNRCDCERGVRFAGGSGVIAPDGSNIGYLDSGDGVVYAQVDLDLTKQKKLVSGVDWMQERRPSLYKNLNLNIYLNNPFSVHRLYNMKPLPEGKASQIGAFQFYPEPFAIEKNLVKIESAAKTACQNDVKVLVLPEFAVSGRVSSLDEAKWVADLIPSEVLIDKCADLAEKYGIYLVLGLVEEGGDKLYNAVFLINGDGLAGKYRKAHLNGVDKLWATAGDKGFKWVDLPLGRIGLLSGDDCVFPESTMCLAICGVDIIAVPAAMHEPKPAALKSTGVPLSSAVTFVGDDPVHWHLWRTRAVETNTVIAFANQIDSGGMGYSGIFGPTDWPRQEKVIICDEGIIFYPIDTSSQNGIYPDKLVRVKENVRMRVPSHYDSLVVEKIE
ncbi:nitrilase-related carbon-nitrogen hydrolase [Syntrophaceticus schinkii]|jgi:predicted amidohydrolase|uniref:Nitrilase/cyanide hydratase and apolipoprotein N-acyltransferase n=1 Tax=Syntrophaceticus schinkii TaxID=499207 RepID=A0A0B7MEH4_9FIRM|nr:nitrilase-related carbon-nitrogen hydrolase [Syntrophaceticus schinkii]CEO88984.1 Nitrilase/cyanide hydratase and apolipoprotein N-acyltransferase [Syntrophaceticus schinkii]